MFSRVKLSGNAVSSACQAAHAQAGNRFPPQAVPVAKTSLTGAICPRSKRLRVSGLQHGWLTEHSLSPTFGISNVASDKRMPNSRAASIEAMALFTPRNW